MVAKLGTTYANNTQSNNCYENAPLYIAFTLENNMIDRDDSTRKPIRSTSGWKKERACDKMGETKNFG